MDLSLRRTVHQSEDRSWLGSSHGTEATESITVYTPAFTRATHYPNGFVPSGMPVALITSGPGAGGYGPYNPALTNGQQRLAGHLFSAVPVRDNAPATVGAALHWHGSVLVSRLPAGHGLDAAGIASITTIRYR